jgi:hypothetical protein
MAHTVRLWCIIELLRNAQDKRARKLAKKRVRLLSTFSPFSSGWEQ